MLSAGVGYLLMLSALCLLPLLPNQKEEAQLRKASRSRPIMNHPPHPSVLRTQSLAQSLVILLFMPVRACERYAWGRNKLHWPDVLILHATHSSPLRVPRLLAPHIRFACRHGKISCTLTDWSLCETCAFPALHLKIPSRVWQVELLNTHYLILPGMQATSRRSSVYAVAVVALFLLAISYSTIISMLAIFPSTSCLRFVGGVGCKSP